MISDIQTDLVQGNSEAFFDNFDVMHKFLLIFNFLEYLNSKYEKNVERVKSSDRAFRKGEQFYEKIGKCNKS